MKYKVIGWTMYENYDIPFSEKTIGFAERNAIIDEIRKHKYLFTGWHHQEWWDNCVPILNDGKKRGFSQRGWGGVMAEAYGYMNDYDYANFTFQQSIKEHALRFPKDDFDPKDFVSELLENEHFDVEVSKELFDIAKKKNPFYLEDIDALRFLEQNDTITLHHQEETLTFLVDDVNRSKKEVEFSKHHLINGKYKVIVTHKPMAKVYTRKPLLILREDANETFKQCIKKYDFNTLLELFDSFNINTVTNDSKAKKAISTIKKFVLEYTDYAFNASLVNKLLYYINEYEFSKEIAHKTFKQNPNILVSFVNYFYQQGHNVDEDINRLLKVYKGPDRYISNILLRAIEINPDKKSLVKRYYKISKHLNYNGLILFMRMKETKGLCKEHRKLIELEDFNSLSTMSILRIAQLMSYPTYDVRNDKNYNYNAPSFFDTPYQCIKDGVLKYQEYVNEKFDLSNRLEELLLTGVYKVCENYKEYYDEKNTAAKYIYALDASSGFRFNLKQKAIKKAPELKEYIKDKYKKK